MRSETEFVRDHLLHDHRIDNAQAGVLALTEHHCYQLAPMRVLDQGCVLEGVLGKLPELVQQDPVEPDPV